MRPLVSLVFALGSLMVSPDAAAHARLQKSAPANGAVLADPPAAMVLTFNSEVERRFARFVLQLPDGRTRTLAAPDGTGITRELTIALGALDRGEHQLRWSVVSRDGHRVAGTVRFTVAAP